MLGESKLVSFHKACKEEYNELLEHFNILFYGYGCKKSLLKFLFPKGILINCRMYTLREILEEILRSRVLMELVSSLKKNRRKHIYLSLEGLDDACYKSGIKLTMVFLNFDFKQLLPFKNTRSFKIVGTLEEVYSNLGHREIEDFNFIFRDLTTFVPYYEDIAGTTLVETPNSVEGMVNIYENVPKKAKFVFLELLKLKKDMKNVYLVDIYNALKKKLLLKDKSECQILLAEFIDHNLIKVKGSEEIVFEFKNTEIHSFFEKCNS